MIGVLWVVVVIMAMISLLLLGAYGIEHGRLVALRAELGNVWHSNALLSEEFTGARETSIRRAGELAASRDALSKSDAENAALRSELAEFQTYATSLRSENESLKRTSAPAAKKNLPPKIVGRKAKRA